MKKILFIVPHLSTGGLPQVTTNKIQLLKDDYVIKCVEYGCYSWDFVVQKNRIKNLIGKDNLITLWDDKNFLINIINNLTPNDYYEKLSYINYNHELAKIDTIENNTSQFFDQFFQLNNI